MICNNKASNILLFTPLRGQGGSFLEIDFLVVSNRGE